MSLENMDSEEKYNMLKLEGGPLANLKKIKTSEDGHIENFVCVLKHCPYRLRTVLEQTSLCLRVEIISGVIHDHTSPEDISNPYSATGLDNNQKEIVLDLI